MCQLVYFSFRSSKLQSKEMAVFCDKLGLSFTLSKMACSCSMGLSSTKEKSFDLNCINAWFSFTTINGGSCLANLLVIEVPCKVGSKNFLHTAVYFYFVKALWFWDVLPVRHNKPFQLPRHSLKSKC